MNTYIHTYTDTSKKTNIINTALRKFIQDTQLPFILLYNNKTELPVCSEDELVTICKKYEQVYECTHIHYFAGKIQPIKTFDYGPVKINYGSIVEQKFVFEFITRQAILETGYFDVRFTDSCRTGDYVFRLSQKKLYPYQDVDKLPCVYDIEHDASNVAKHTFDELSSGWFNYKYKAFPQTKQLETLESVITNIKNFKNNNEQK
jgi:hypothetical protein